MSSKDSGEVSSSVVHSRVMYEFSRIQVGIVLFCSSQQDHSHVLTNLEEIFHFRTQQNDALVFKKPGGWKVCLFLQFNRLWTHEVVRDRKDATFFASSFSVFFF